MNPLALKLISNQYEFYLIFQQSINSRTLLLSLYVYELTSVVYDKLLDYWYEVDDHVIKFLCRAFFFNCKQTNHIDNSIRIKPFDLD